MPITGVEPAAEMRRKAMVPKTIGIAYRDGLAQNIPLEAGSARAVPLRRRRSIWFDRPYALRGGALRRILMPSGLLAIVEYVRDEQHSPAAAAVVEFSPVMGPGKRIPGLIMPANWTARWAFTTCSSTRNPWS